MLAGFVHGESAMIIVSASRAASRALPCLAAFLVAILNPSETMASPCEGVPHCETQQMTPVSFKALQTKGWAFYCTGDHPYYWNNDATLGFGNNFSFDNKCFTVTESVPGENEPSKMDATITNWCLKKEKITVTIGCSQQPQNGPNCPGATKVTSDPGCPIQGSPRNTCAGNPPVCTQTWTENCANGPAFCTKDFVLPTWCVVCA